MRDSFFDQQVAEAQDAMLRAGEWPANKPTPVYRKETPEYSALLYYSKDDFAWVLKKTHKGVAKFAESTSTLKGSLHDLSLELLNQQAQVSLANQAVEDEDYRLENDPEYAACNDFLSNYREGQVYKEMMEYLSGPETEELWDSLKRSIAARQWQMNGNSIAAAHNHLLDNNTRYGQLYDKAMQQRDYQQRLAQEQADALATAHSKTVPVEKNPFENTRDVANYGKNVRSPEQQDEDAALRKLSSAELKQKYLASMKFGPQHRH